MHDATVFSPQREAAAIAAMQQHNAMLFSTLAAYAEALVTAASLQRRAAADYVRLEMYEWCRTEILGHAQTEEAALYSRARAEVEGSMLVESMLEEHGVMARFIEELGGASDPVRAVAAASALLVVLESHLDKENTQLLPLLARSPYVSLADQVAGRVELAGAGSEALGRTA